MAELTQTGFRVPGYTVNISEYYSLRVKGSIPVRDTFFAEYILLQFNSGIVTRMIYYREISIDQFLLGFFIP